jgi:hypothetical protein
MEKLLCLQAMHEKRNGTRETNLRNLRPYTQSNVKEPALPALYRPPLAQLGAFILFYLFPLLHVQKQTSSLCSDDPFRGRICIQFLNLRYLYFMRQTGGGTICPKPLCSALACFLSPQCQACTSIQYLVGLVKKKHKRGKKNQCPEQNQYSTWIRPTKSTHVRCPGQTSQECFRVVQGLLSQAQRGLDISLLRCYYISRGSFGITASRNTPYLPT